MERRALFDTLLADETAEYSTGSDPRWVVAEDLNGDGAVDLAVGHNAGGVGIFMNEGDGRFGSPVVYESSLSFIRLAPADFDGDGDTDLACAAGAVLLNVGDGTFTLQRSYVGSSSGLLAVGDFNGDGAPDIGFTNGDSIGVTLNDGTGRFGRAVFTPKSSGIGDLEASDFDRDGLDDLVYTLHGRSSMTGWTVHVLLHRGNGQFQQATYETPLGPSGISVADFNGDAWCDLAVTSSTDITSSTSTFSLFLNRGDGTFAPRQDFGERGGSHIVAVDANHDGLLDVIVQSGIIRVLLNTGTGYTEVTSVVPETYTPNYGMAVADLDGDSTPDVAMVSAERNVMRVTLFSAFPRDTTIAARFSGSLSSDTIFVAPTAILGAPAVVININGIVSQPFVPTAPIEIHGLAGNDTITVDPDVAFPVILYGDDGDDVLVGGRGADLIYGGDGNDVVSGGGGNDTLYGNFGSDKIMAGVGDDQVFGGIGRDVITGGEGNDTLLGGNGTDDLRGGAGHDRLEGKGKADTLYGGDGNDTIISGAGADLISGEAGDDLLDATPHMLFRDTLFGGAGHDRYIADEDDLLQELEEVLA